MFKSKPTFEKLKKEKDAIDLKIDKEITKYMELIIPYENVTDTLLRTRAELDPAEDKYEATETEIFKLMKKVNTVLKSREYNDDVDQHMTTIAMLEERAAVEEAEFFEILARLEILDNGHDDLRFTLKAHLDKIKKLVMQKRKINKQINILIQV